MELQPQTGGVALKFYHIADVHLGAVPDRTMPWSRQRERGLYESLYRLLERAKREQADVIFICGDLFHRQPLKRELKELNYHFEKAAPVMIFIIAGNHDYIGENSNYVNFSWGSNVAVMAWQDCRRMYVERLKLCVYGFSYHSYVLKEAAYDRLRPQLSDGKGGVLPGDCCHILMAHGGDENHAPVHMNVLAGAGFDYIAMGHIHKPWLSPDGKMGYCGALEPVDKNDEGPHGYIEGEVIGRQVRTRFVPFAQWSYVNLNVEVSPQMSWEAIKDALRGQMQDQTNVKAIYKIRLSGYKAADLVYDAREIYELGPVVSVADEMEYDFDFDMLYEENRGNLLGRFMEKVQALDTDMETRKKILNYGFRALYHTGEQP